MALLATAPSSTLKELFDPDIILGLGLALALDCALAYIAINVYHPLMGRPFGEGSAYDIMAWDDVLLFAIEIGGVLLAKGRLRKIFIYALWFTICLMVAGTITWKTGLHFWL